MVYKNSYSTPLSLLQPLITKHQLKNLFTLMDYRDYSTWLVIVPSIQHLYVYVCRTHLLRCNFLMHLKGCLNYYVFKLYRSYNYKNTCISFLTCFFNSSISFLCCLFSFIRSIKFGRSSEWFSEILLNSSIILFIPHLSSGMSSKHITLISYKGCSEPNCSNHCLLFWNCSPSPKVTISIDGSHGRG